MNLRLIPLLAGLLPFFGVHIAFELEAQAGNLPYCFPYFEGCTSISSTGRVPPGSFWFKGLMIPGAVCMAVYWVLMVTWLRAMGERREGVLYTVLALGLVSAVGLVFYNMVLGHIGEDFRLMRRIGITLYFGLGYLAQLVVISRLYYLREGFPGWIFNSKLTVCALILAWGLGNVALSAYSPHNDMLQNIIEWNVGILNNAYYVLTFFLWRTTAFSAAYNVTPRIKI